MLNPYPDGQQFDTQLEKTKIETSLSELELEKLDLESQLESLELEVEKYRTLLAELELCLAVSDKFSVDSQGRPAPLLPGEEPVPSEGHGVSAEDN